MGAFLPHLLLASLVWGHARPARAVPFALEFGGSHDAIHPLAVVNTPPLTCCVGIICTSIRRPTMVPRYGRLVSTWLTGVGVLLASLGAARIAQADEQVRLVYVRDAGPSECPDEPKLRRWVAARLGYDPFDAQAASVLVARVELRDERLEGSVETIDQHGVSGGRRALSSAATDCQALARAMALSISLAIDPERASLAGPELTEPEEAAEPPAAAPSEPPPAAHEPVAPEAPPPPPKVSAKPVPRARARAAAHVFTGAAFASNIAALPTTAFGGEITLGVRRERWSLALQGRALQSVGRDLEPRGQVSGALFGGSLNGCWHFEPLAACLVGQSALQRLSGSGVSDGRSSSGTYWAIGPRLVGHVPLGRELALMMAVEGALNLAPNIAVLSGHQVWKVPLFAGTLLVGVRAQFL
jgi:hypothetical protein